jgi:hypothetical protein
VPIAGARLRLQNAITAVVFDTSSDEHGRFEFGPIPDGTYVLHIEGGATGRAYDPTDMLMKISARGRWTEVVLQRQEPGATNCGDATLWSSSWR